MANPSGSNQWQNGEEPPEDELVAELLQYAKDRLPLETRIECLAMRFGYHIRPTKLKMLNKKYNIPSARKPIPYALATSYVCEKLAEDPERRNGPVAVQKMLAAEGIVIPRSMVRSIMHENDPIGALVRDPRLKRKGVHRTAFVTEGSMLADDCSLTGVSENAMSDEGVVSALTTVCSERPSSP